MKKKIVTFIALLSIAMVSCDETLDDAYTLTRPYYPNSFMTEEGMVFYSNTKQDQLVKIKDNYARVMGYFDNYIELDTIAEFGHCWLEAEGHSGRYPTVEDYIDEYINTDNSNTTPYFNKDNGNVDSFETRLNYLESETDYYVRAYVKDKNGKVAYSPLVLKITTETPENTWRIANLNDQIFTLPGSSRIHAITAKGQDGADNKKEKIYYGMGYNGFDVLGDFWELDLETGTWAQKTSFMNGGTGYERKGAVAFGIGTRVYAGTGEDRYGGIRDDFWAFNTYSNRWEQKENYKNGFRRYAVGFSINGKGYIGLGENLSTTGTTNYPNFAEFDPEDETTKGVWYGSSSIPSWNQNEARIGAVVFVINGRAFVGLGSNNNQYFNNFHQYTPNENVGAAGSWAVISENFPGEAREFAAAFTIDERGYVGTGRSLDATGNLVAHDDFYRYDPFNRKWETMANYMGGKRYGAVGIGLPTKGFLGGGRQFTETNEWQYQFDIFEYLP